MSTINLQSVSPLQTPWWHRISVRISIGVILIISLTLTAIVWQTEKHAQNIFHQQYVVNASKFVKMLADRLSERTKNQSGLFASFTNKEMVRFVDVSTISRIFFLDRSGQIKVSSDGTLNGLRIRLDDNPECPRCSSHNINDFPGIATLSNGLKPQWLRIVYPVTATRTTASPSDWHGFVLVDFDLHALESAAQQRRTVSLITGIVSGVIIVLLVFWHLRDLVIRPLHTVVCTADQLAEGHLHARVVLEDHNELSQLGDRLNEMATRIQKQIVELEESNIASDLLYTLVANISRNMEMSEIASAVVTTISEKLRPAYLAFFIDSGQSKWICAMQGSDTLLHGTGTLDGLFLHTQGLAKQLLLGLPYDPVINACRDRELQSEPHGKGFLIAIPLVANRWLQGMLICDTGSQKIRLTRDHIKNLMAHLALALQNARNYTGSITDALTHLRNKRYGLLRLEEAIHVARRNDSELTLAMIDIDYFKDINDTHGHPVGDTVLKAVSQLIVDELRKSDVPVRYGGEEFMLILPFTTAEHAAEICNRLRTKMETTPIPIAGKKFSISVTASFGIARFRIGIDDSESLTMRADQALYRAKRAGRNCMEIDDGQTTIADT